MKSFSLHLLAIAVLLSGCIGESIRPSGITDTEEYVFSDYNAVEISDAFEVFVQYSDTEELIQIEASDNILPYVRVIQTDNNIRIKIANGIRIRGNNTLIARITTDDLSQFEVSGASRVVLQDPLEISSVDIELSGASTFVGDIVADNLTVDMSGASDVDLAGTIGNYTLESSGASTARDYYLITDNLDVELSGGSRAYVTVNNEIMVDASGASNLYYKGTGVIVDQNISGGSNVKKTN